MNKLTQLALISLAFTGSAFAAPKSFTYCLESSPAALNPQIATDGATLDVGQAIYNRLIDFEKGTTNLTPSLAERWEISEGGKIYTFFLASECAVPE
ncbi:Periplasmic dipeptide transport protein [Mannheimia haemolytica]